MTLLMASPHPSDTKQLVDLFHDYLSLANTPEDRHLLGFSPAYQSAISSELACIYTNQDTAVSKEGTHACRAF
jgi:hypothetical protein